ncbi:MAG: hypothetical protein OEY96_08480, partial [Gammaproteobacteria bacterium]|nr:hypothetical protein [Gammaproteobacteria bacterium]
MKTLNILFLISALQFIAISHTFAEALFQYEVSDIKQPPFEQQQAKCENKRESKIKNAAEQLKQAAPERQKKMIAAYIKRIKEADEAKRFKEAAFYIEILERSGIEYTIP